MSEDVRREAVQYSTVHYSTVQYSWCMAGECPLAVTVYCLKLLATAKKPAVKVKYGLLLPQMINLLI